MKGVPIPAGSVQDSTGWSGRHPERGTRDFRGLYSAKPAVPAGLEAEMTGLQHQQEQQSQSHPMRGIPLLLRLTWMTIGNVALVFFAALVAKGTAPRVMDALYFVVVIGLIVVRHVDVTRFQGLTSEGKPATIADWRRYAIRIVVISVGVWALARVAHSYHWL